MNFSRSPRIVPLLLAMVFASTLAGSAQAFVPTLAQGDDAADTIVTEPSAIRQQLEGMIVTFEQGGQIMWLLLVLSIVGLAFVLERTFRLDRAAVCPYWLPRAIDQLWRDGRHDEIERICDSDRSAMARIISYINRHRRNDPAVVAEGSAELAVRELRPHQRRTYPLAVVATVAPLLGLTGTVQGMIGAFADFRALGEAGDPGIFADNISMALVTTLFGLLIAAPALLFYHIFRSQVGKLSDMLELDLSDVLDEWILLREDATGVRREPSDLSVSAVLFSFDGRINRQTFWIKGWLPLAIIGGAMTGLILAMSVTMNSEKFFTYAMLIVSVLMMWPMLAIWIKRAHDRDHSAAYLLILFIPILGVVWLLAELGFLKGTAGDNDYGPDVLDEEQVAPSTVSTEATA